MAPIVVPSIFPPLISTVVKVDVPVASREVKVAAAAVVAPIVVPSIFPPLMSTVVKVDVPVASREVKVAAAATDAPIVVPSIFPPLISTVVNVEVPVAPREVKLAAAAMLAPIVVPSIFPPLISTVVNVEVPVTSRSVAYNFFAFRSLRVWSVAPVSHLDASKSYKNWVGTSVPEYTCIPAVVEAPPVIMGSPLTSVLLTALIPSKFSEVICSAVSKIVLLPSTIKEPRIYTVPLLVEAAAVPSSS